MQPKPFQRSRHGAFLRQILLIVAAGIVLAAWLPRAPWVVPLLLVALAPLPIALVGRAFARERWSAVPARVGVLGCVLAVAILYGYLAGLSQLSSRLPACVVDVSAKAPLLITADVIEPVRLRPGQARLRLATVQAAGSGGCDVPRGRILDVSWFDPPAVQIGDRLNVLIALRPPRGLANPGGFDYERWLFSEKVDGLGSIRSGHVTPRALALGKVGAARDWLSSIRARAREAVMDAPLLHPGALLALSIGDAGLVPGEHWQRFRDTGTIHLMVISGLHIGIAFLLLHGICRLLVTTLAVATRVGIAQALSAASALAWLGTGFLVALTGFSEPALRAWLMLGGYLLVRAVGRESSALLVLLQVFSVVVVLRPLSVLTQGLWLSFFAVAVLVLFANRLRGSTLTQLLLLQGLMALAMAPAIAFFNGQLVLSAAFANAIAAPLASVVLVPLSMLSVLFATLELPGASALLTLADVTAHVLYALLDRANALAPMPLARGDLLRYALAMLGGFLILLPVRWPLRVLGGFALALMLVPISSGIQSGEFRLQVLDVGQGSAAIVDTMKHRVIIDAGYRSPHGFDMGEAVVIPAFLATGPRRLDLFVISHGDIDHSGGAAAVTKILAPAITLAGAGTDSEFSRCQAGWEWRRDGVVVSIAAANLSAPNDNDGSCVVRIENGDRAVLLPGDISAREEFRLALMQPAPLDLLVAAHHGSRSSSSARFLRVTAPSAAVVSAGFANRFGHPHADVLARFAASGTTVFRTDESGAVTWLSSSDTTSKHRSGYQPYWRAVSRR